MDTIVTHLSVIITRANGVRTAGEAGQVAWRIPAASAAGIVRSGPGAGRDVREWETEMNCSSEPGVIAAGAGALPGARRRCEAGKRTHGPGTRTCLALLAATALLALAAPAQAQTEVWSATLTPVDLSGGILGCTNGVPTARCSSTSLLSEDSFNYDSTDYTITGLFLLHPDGRFQFRSTPSSPPPPPPSPSWSAAPPSSSPTPPPSASEAGPGTPPASP